MNDTFPASLSREEWQAAWVGAHDAQAGCRAAAVPVARKGRFGRLAHWLFGDHAPLPLANPRLEALRRYACALGSGSKPDGALVDELHARGIDAAQLAALTAALV